MASKRASKKAAEHRQAPSWAGPLLALLLVLLSAQLLHLWLSQPGRLPLREIQVEGEFQQVSLQAVRERVLPLLRAGFLGVDMAQIRSAVRDLPWVAEVGVRREWPDRLRIQVTEQKPLARWGGEALVNLQGQVFAPQVLPDLEGLPSLNGDDAMAPRMVHQLLALQNRLVGSGLRISQLSLNPRGEWQVDFENGVQLALGGISVMQRFADFLQVYPQLHARGQLGLQRVDMRYEHGFAVRWQEPPSGLAGLDTAGGDS